jgi:uncharacterized membrane protein YfcA
MDIFDILILAAIGFSSGLLSGFLGVGGGILIVPSLVFFFGLSQHMAQGTSLAIMILPIGFFAARKYYMDKKVNVQYAIFLSLSFILGSYLGSTVSLSLDEKTLKKIFGIFLLFIAIKTYLGIKKSP